MRYQFDLPAGFVAEPFPPPQRGVRLRGARGVILLLDAIAPDGTLAAQLDEVVRDGCRDGEVLGRAPVVAFRSAAFPGLAAAVRLRVAGHDEGRLFALLHAGGVRLPVVFLGARDAMSRHRAELARLLASITSVSVPCPDVPFATEEHDARTE